MKTVEQMTLPSESADPRIEISKRDDDSIRIDCTSDWCGDTESGFGASVGVTLSKDDARKLLAYLQAVV